MLQQQQTHQTMPKLSLWPRSHTVQNPFACANAWAGFDMWVCSQSAAKSLRHTIVTFVKPSGA
jgi:hypothetical protein